KTRKHLACVREHLVLVLCDSLNTQALQIINRGGQADRACHIGSAGFELVWQLVVESLLEGDRPDHVTTALLRRHRIKQRKLYVQDADPHRPIHLVTGEGVKVAAKFLDIDLAVRHSLSAINHHGDILPMSNLNDLANGIDRPQRIRDVSYSHDLCSGIDQLLEFIEQQFAAIVNWRHSQACALLLTNYLPRDDIRMMLHGGDEDLVPSPNVSTPIGLGDQVDSLSRTTNKDDLFRSRRVYELLHGFARCFMLFGCMLREEMN